MSVPLYEVVHLAGAQVAFGKATLCQGPSQGGGVITCVVPEVIDLLDDDEAEDIREGHVDAACVCCELVARLRTTTAEDEALQRVLDAVLSAITGKAQDPSRVQQLFEDRFKLAGGGQLMIEGRGAQQMIEDAAPATGSKFRRVTLTSTEDQQENECVKGGDDGPSAPDTRTDPPQLQGVAASVKVGPVAQEKLTGMSTPTPMMQPAKSLASTPVPAPSSCTQAAAAPLRSLLV